jgi:hypothetical protein
MGLCEIIRGGVPIDSSLSSTSAYPVENKAVNAAINSAKTTLQNNINNVVQSGSNSNGSFVKYDDGTMICYKHVNVTVSVTNTWGAIYECPAFSLGNFPASFTAAPVISATVSTTKSLSAGYGGWLEGIFASTASFVGQTYILRPTSASNVPYTIDIIAIGKWK